MATRLRGAEAAGGRRGTHTLAWRGHWQRYCTSRTTNEVHRCAISWRWPLGRERTLRMSHMGEFRAEGSAAAKRPPHVHILDLGLELTSALRTAGPRHNVTLRPNSVAYTYRRMLPV
jgi:hypothetical protein